VTAGPSGEAAHGPRVAPRLHHAAIRCHDLGRAERFYREVLGLEVLRRWPRTEAEGGGDRSVWLALSGGGFLALERVEGGRREEGGAAGSQGLGATAPEGRGAEASDVAPAGWHVMALSMDRGERPAWEARLAARGVPVERRTPYSIFLRDPEGNRLALTHWPEEST